jgi:hypothetical protein
MSASNAGTGGMNELFATVQNEFNDWSGTPPNLINRGLGAITKPIAIILNPVMDKLAPAMEGIMSGMNNFIASAIDDVSANAPDLEKMDEESFKKWFEAADVSAKNWKTTGISLLGVEGGTAGLGGIALVLVEIPASFGTIMGIANKIALTYGLPIKTEECQIAILNAITAGSANTLKEKAAAVANLKMLQKALDQTWKQMYKVAADNVFSIEAVIVAVREALKKIGINITHRKAGQIIPGIGAATGAIINAAWAADALESVRQYARLSVVEKYAKK